MELQYLTSVMKLITPEILTLVVLVIRNKDANPAGRWYVF